MATKTYYLKTITNLSPTRDPYFAWTTNPAYVDNLQEGYVGLLNYRELETPAGTGEFYLWADESLSEPSLTAVKDRFDVEVAQLIVYSSAELENLKDRFGSDNYEVFSVVEEVVEDYLDEMVERSLSETLTPELVNKKIQWIDKGVISSITGSEGTEAVIKESLTATLGSYGS